MQSSLELVINQHLTKYLAGDVSLEDFKDWLVGATWHVEQSGEPAAVELTYDIKLLLAEQSSEELPESELRELLRPLVREGVATRR